MAEAWKGTSLNFEGFVRQRNPGMPFKDVLWYALVRRCIWMFAVPVWRFKAIGVEHMPREGGLIIVANHQSHLDPPIISLLPRHMFFLARKSLFEGSPFFAWWIRKLNAIPLDQDRGDTAAMKTAITHLNQGRVVLLFAEGARTMDGAMNQFKPGAALLIRRARVPVMPLAIEGAHDVWARGTRRPRFSGIIRIKAGPIIMPQEFESLGTAEGLERVRSRVEDLRQQLRAQMRRETGGTFPKAGTGDFRYDDPRIPTRIPAD